MTIYIKLLLNIFEADIILAISETTKNDVVYSLGIDESRILVIYGGNFLNNKTIDKRPKIIELEINNYILLASGDDPRKNNILAAQAIDLYNKTNNTNHYLVVTSTFSDVTKDEMLKQCKDIIFTGNVENNELAWLYKNSLCILFPSIYEGLGMPIIEALQFSKKVCCSDIDAFREILSTNVFYFDPLSIKSISESLKTTIHTKKQVTKNRDILAKFSWEFSSKATIKFLRKMDAPAIKINKKKVIIFSPSPSGYSAIGKFVLELHAELSKHFDITYFFEDIDEQVAIRPNFLKPLAISKDDFSTVNIEDYDRAIFHIGNSEYHIQTLRLALAHSGTVILHDTDIEGLYYEMAGKGYINESRLLLEKLINKKQKSIPFMSYISSMLNVQHSVVVHSKLALNNVRQLSLAHKPNIQQLNLSVTHSSRKQIKHFDKVSKKLKVGFAGIITESKGLDAVFLLSEIAGCSVSVFGLSINNKSIEEKIRKTKSISINVNLTDLDFMKSMGALDLLICYRENYKGETSKTVLEAMSYGVIPIVNDIGWFSELPNNCVIKVSNLSEMHKVVNSIISETAQYNLDRMKEDCMEYIKMNHSHKVYSKQLSKVV